MSADVILGDYVKVQGGFAYKSKDFKNSGVPVIKIKNVGTGRLLFDDYSCVDEELAQTTKDFFTKPGDVLISMTGSGPNQPGSLVGRVARVGKKDPRAVINQRVGRLVLKKDKAIDLRFIFYLLTTKRAQEYLVGNSTGSANQANISGKTIESFPFSQVTYDESVEIADILESLDAKIELNRQINQTLEQIAQTIFKSWFVDFEPVKAKIEAKAAGRNPERAAMCAISGKPEPELDQLSPEQCQQLAATAALFPDELVESELGLIPLGWEVKQLSEMVQLIGGGTPKRSNAEFWGGDIPWFSVQDAPPEGDAFVVDTEEKITKIGLEKSSTRLLPIGTTIISARGTVGRLALVGVEMAMNQSCYGVVGDYGIGQYFNYLNLKDAVSTLQQNTHGAVFDTITRQTFETVSCVKPTKPVLDHFEVLLAPLMEAMRSNVVERRTLATLRDTLLPKLLSGEFSTKKMQLG